MNRTTALLLALAGCTPITEPGHDRVGCQTVPTSTGASSSISTSSTSTSSTSTSSGSSTSTSTTTGSTSTGGQSPGLPTPTALCPAIVDGTITICPASLASCREAVVVNASASSGGPLALHWHGTYETPEGLLSWDSAAIAIRQMVEAEDGLLVLPRADPDAEARPGNPFPWWVVCGAGSPSQCGRHDDFALADEIVACALEQGLVDPTRLTSSGFSAGAIQVSHLLDRVGYLAGVVSWSGGLPPEYQPATPPGSTSVLALHGGPSDVFCDGSGCYDFVGPSEALAIDVAATGAFSFVCDHQSGHSTSMGPQGAAFLRDAHADGHEWSGYPFGYPGTGPDWMLNHYCYAAGTASPWGSP